MSKEIQMPECRMSVIRASSFFRPFELEHSVASSFHVLLIAAAVVAGCGRSTSVCPVSGTVSYNGTAVTDGSIVFIPADKHLAADGGKITDGRFAFLAKAGRQRVEIRAVREVGKVIPSMGVKARQSYLSATYNSESTPHCRGGARRKEPVHLRFERSGAGTAELRILPTVGGSRYAGGTQVIGGSLVLGGSSALGPRLYPSSLTPRRWAAILPRARARWTRRFIPAGLKLP